MTHDPTIQWHCDKCGEDITGSTGYLSVHMPAVNQAERARQERATDPSGRGPDDLDLPLAADWQRQKVQWRVYHTAL